MQTNRTVPVSMLCLIATGRGTLVINDVPHLYEPHQLFYFGPGTRISIDTIEAETQYYQVVIHSVTAMKHGQQWTLKNAPGQLKGLTTGALTSRDPDQIQQRIIELYHLIHRDGAVDGNGATDPNLQLQGLLDFLLSDSAKKESPQISNHGIDACISYIHQQYHQKITRETLAEIAMLTPNAFCRSFKRATGISFTDYLNRVRIKHAKDRLTASCSIKEVASTVGYSSEYYFSRLFKEAVGYSPTLYIKRERLKIAAASRTGFHNNLASIGLNPAAGVDCFRYPWMNDADYNLRLTSALEQLRLVKPDLIIADYFHKSLYEVLKQIAPTVVLAHHLDWRLTHMNIAELVGREKEASQSFHQLDERTSEARYSLNKWIGNARVTVMQIVPHALRIQGAVNHPLNELLYAELGMKPGNAVSPTKMRDEMQVEEFPSLETEHLFIIKHINHPESDHLFKRLIQTPAWSLIPAVASQQTHYIPNWLLMSWTPIGRSKIIHDLTEMLRYNSIERAPLPE
ncbi:AraC family transcriptional regulator [Paenibacillus sp. HWE-109]|uniref:helix-turn-helix domain-containing protein n=1 Tax=Paenibacillus sp. HWE-109 TaxID=1306526 RepID=UPI001EE1302F|nr:helix-turn-helix domain-containing protein [Paenibacillus sp. HWE-109]UKS28450.1 AraC family transcriptional regulator [Paenibacillus sp. HWE-109]